MQLEKINGNFTVYKAREINSLKKMLSLGGFCFIGVTDKEISVLCDAENVPSEVLAREDGWKGLRVAGSLDFELTGVLSSITSVLADNGIAIFAVSTFDTDFIFVKYEFYEKTLSTLLNAGFSIIN